MNRTEQTAPVLNALPLTEGLSIIEYRLCKFTRECRGDEPALISIGQADSDPQYMVNIEAQGSSLHMHAWMCWDLS